MRTATACLAATCLAGLSAGQGTEVKLSNGVEMPLAAMGVWQYKPDQAEAAIKLAFQVGFTHIDTANDYFNEKGVGKAVAEAPIAREKIFLTTKVPGCGRVGIGQTGLLPCSSAYKSTQKFLDGNLDLLNQPYVDLTLVHFPPTDPSADADKICTFVQAQVRDAPHTPRAARRTRRTPTNARPPARPPAHLCSGRPSRSSTPPTRPGPSASPPTAPSTSSASKRPRPSPPWSTR
jgi:hypothetical protein